MAWLGLLSFQNVKNYQNTTNKAFHSSFLRAREVERRTQQICVQFGATNRIKLTPFSIDPLVTEIY